jgi:SAM-dependent methyltransferase
MFDVRKHWDQVAKNIEARKDEEKLAGYNSLLDRKVRERFLAILREIDFNDKKVVELGCGTGLNMLELSKQNPSRLMGLDISKNMIAIAGETVKSIADTRIEFLQIDGENIPLEERGFDIGITVTVLQHNSNDELLSRLSSNFAKIIKERLYIFEDTAKKTRGTEDYMLRTIDQYRGIFESNGFSMIEVLIVKMYFTQKVFSLINRIFGLYKKTEGVGASRLLIFIQTLIYPLTGLLDRVMNSNEGLTMMVFERKKESH